MGLDQHANEMQISTWAGVEGSGGVGGRRTKREVKELDGGESILDEQKAAALKLWEKGFLWNPWW